MTESTPPTDPRTADASSLVERFRERVRRHPDKPACVEARGPRAGGRVRYRVATFGQIEEDSDQLAAGLARAGFARGMKTAMLVRPGRDLFSVTLALLKIGAPLVLVDAGMGLRRLMDCLRDVNVEGFVGIVPAQLARMFCRRTFAGIRAVASTGPFGWGGVTLDSARRDGRDILAKAAAKATGEATAASGEGEGETAAGAGTFAAARPEADECGAILFTTGSTGPAKGVRYTHALLENELQRMEVAFDVRPDDVDCATFPGFSLFSLLMGMTVVVPDMDPTRPGFVDPMRIVTPIRDWGCTFSFGSPALWKRVGGWCAERGLRLPGLTRVVMAGAPAGVDVHRLLCERVLSAPDADTYSPYGATEAMPVALIRGSEILRATAARTRRGAGACLGAPVPDTEVAVIEVTEGPIAEWSDSLRLPAGRIGELCVKGGQVTRQYYNRPDATARAKIPEDAAGPDGGEAGFWHRMGDAGYIDEDGRLWFCGRVAHRVVTADGPMYTIPCEAIFNEHPAVARSALVGVPLLSDPSLREPRIVVELKPEAARRPDYGRIGAELLALGAANPLTASIRAIHFHPRFPTDIRHNVKIDREALARWAAAGATES